MTRAVAAIFALFVLTIAGIGAYEAALEAAGSEHTVTNETWTPDAGTVTTLNKSNLGGAYYDHNVTVYDEFDTRMDRSTDYRWFPGNGTIKAVVGGGLDGDANATVTYSYQLTTGQQRALTGVLGTLLRMVVVVAPLFVVILFFLVVSG